MRPAIFLDKDGTLVEDVPYNVDPALIRLAPGAIEALRLWHRMGYALVVVTNQSGAALGYFPVEALRNVEQRLRDMLEEHNLPLAGFYYCPHFVGGLVSEFAKACNCRKPMPGLLLQAALDLQIDLKASWMVGDILNDIEAGHRAGCRAVLVNNGGETEWNLDNPLRQPDHIVSDLLEAASVIAGPHADQVRGLSEDLNVSHT